VVRRGGNRARLVHRRVGVAFLIRSFSVFHAVTAGVVDDVPREDEVARIVLPTGDAVYFLDALTVLVTDVRGRAILGVATLNAKRVLVASVVFLEAVEARHGRPEFDAGVVARTVRRHVLVHARTLDGAKVLTPPFDRSTGAGALLRVDGYGRAHAVTVAAEVARTRVVHAVVEERLRVHQRMARLEEVALDNAAFLFSP